MIRKTYVQRRLKYLVEKTDLGLFGGPLLNIQDKIFLQENLQKQGLSLWRMSKHSLDPNSLPFQAISPSQTSLILIYSQNLERKTLWKILPTVLCIPSIHLLGLYSRNTFYPSSMVKEALGVDATFQLSQQMSFPYMSLSNSLEAWETSEESG